jgi:RHS repeat-associated protein
MTGISYHRRGSLTKWAYPSQISVNYRYDPAGNLVAREDKTGTTQYRYDDYNRPVEVTTPGGKKIAYEFDPWGQIQQITLSDGYRLQYQYDLFGKVIQVDGGYGSIRYEHQANRLLRRLPNGVTSTFEYAPAGQLVALRHAHADGTLLCAYRYEYDPEDRVSLVEEATPQGQATTRYKYDLSGRLSETQLPNGSTITYEYDAMGNRLAQTEGKRLEYKYNAEGQLVKAGQATFSYDKSGNLIAKEDGAQRTTYQYDEENRLIEVNAGNTTISYGYDGDGNRVWRKVNGKVSRYLHHLLGGMPQVIAEYDETGKASHHLLGQSHLAQRTATGEITYRLEDHLGSTRCLVDAQGKVLARYSYSPFGVPTSDKDTALTPFLYTGEPWDQEAQLLYLRARYYDPQLGRFLSPDPAPGDPHDPQTFNQYVYVNNDPINKVDPLGLQWQPPPYYNPHRDWGSHLPQPVNPHDLAGITQEKVESRVYFGGISIKVASVADLLKIGHVKEALGPLKDVGKIADYGVSYNPQNGLTLKGKVLGVSGIGPDYLRRPKLGETIVDKVSVDILAPVKIFAKNPVLSRIGANVIFESKRTTVLTPGLQAAVDEFNRKQNNHFSGGLVGDGKPGGSAASVPSVGGVYLDRTAKILGELGAITGAMYDAESGQLILVGDKNTALPPMKPEYLAAAIRAVYAESAHEPGMTIDPHPQNPRGPVMVVLFFGNTESTRLGWVMFEADRVMKGYSVGADNVTKQPVQSSIPGYRSVTAMGLADRPSDAGLWSRFWLVPEPVTARVTEDGRSVLFDPIKMCVKTETMRWVGGKLVPAVDQASHEENENRPCWKDGKVVFVGDPLDPHAAAFARHFTENYEKFAQENPIYAELQQVAQAVALAKWMKQQNLPVDWNFVRIFAGQPYATPKTTPSAYAELSESFGTYIRKVTSFGGVKMTPQLAPQKHAEVAPFQANLGQAWAAARKQEKSAFSLKFNNKEYEAVALPSSQQRELAAHNTAASDLAGWGVSEAMASLPGLTRSYNSTHNEPTEFGFSWSLLLPRLEFEAALEQGNAPAAASKPSQGKKLQYVSVEGDPATRVLVQQFTLTNQFGLGQERFDKHFVDQNLKRIGFAPTQPSSNFRGLYPEGDGTYRIIFANNDQAIFDAQGKLRAMLTPDSKAVYDYDENNRLRALKLTRASQEEQVQFDYNDQGRIAACDSGGRRVAYEYDETGNLKAVKSGARTITYRYNDKRLLTAIAVNGETLEENSYDEMGRLVQQQDRYGNQRKQSIETGAQGKVLTLRDGAQTWRRSYDPQLRLTKTEDSSGATTQYSYDEKGRLARIEAALPTGGRAKLELASDGKRLLAQDPRGVQTEYRFGANGQLAEILVNNRRATIYRYEGDQLAEVTYEGGNAEQYVYDSAGRLAQYRRIVPGGAALPEHILNYSYDPQGNLAGISNPVWGQISLAKQPQTMTVGWGPATLTYQYDSTGRLASVAAPNGATMTYAYQSDGQLQTIETSQGGLSGRVEFTPEKAILHRSLTGGQTKYTYTAAGFLSSVQEPSGALTSYHYDGKNRLQRIEFPNGRCLQYVYDPATGRLREEHSVICRG